MLGKVKRPILGSGSFQSTDSTRRFNQFGLMLLHSLDAFKSKTAPGNGSKCQFLDHVYTGFNTIGSSDKDYALLIAQVDSPRVDMNQRTVMVREYHVISFYGRHGKAMQQSTLAVFSDLGSALGAFSKKVAEQGKKSYTPYDLDMTEKLLKDWVSAGTNTVLTRGQVAVAANDFIDDLLGGM